MPDYESVIGLEVHAQLLTKSKMFCSCAASYGDLPGTNVCPVCLGHPGSLPVVNGSAVDMAGCLAAALNCRIHSKSLFARKNYIYPDLPKGYQVSQYESPLAEGGWLTIESGNANKRVGITRVHLEEDAGKSLHEGFRDSSDHTYIDFNRAGVPLIEIVSEPDLRLPEEAYLYLVRLKQILTYLGICSGKMEEGSLRCDVNVSLRPRGSVEMGEKVEIKNLNSFRNAEAALQFEIARQSSLLESGGEIKPETRLYDAEGRRTILMRTKEEADDYRYFPEPDLPPLVLSDEQIQTMCASVPELPHEKKSRYVEEWKLTEKEADILTDDHRLAVYFEQTAAACGDPRTACHWILTEVLSVLKESASGSEKFAVGPSALGDLLRRLQEGTVSGKLAKDIFSRMIETGRDAGYFVETMGMVQISSEEELRPIVEKVVTGHPKEAEAFRNGKSKLFGYFVGCVMKETGGKANPKVATRLLHQELKGK
ncbi:MAG: Asp-tRNA(Asn)/Glu-tRNA(Gln) amidotransferase subunit GatB [Acidobacteriota bacterium]